MTLLLPTLAVAFAAFCVWLTVRIVNRRERNGRTLACIGVMGIALTCGIGFAGEPALSGENTNELIDKVAGGDYDSFFESCESLEATLIDKPDPVAIQRLAGLLTAGHDSGVTESIVTILRQVACRRPECFERAVETLCDAVPRMSPYTRPDLIKLIGEIGKSAGGAIESLRATAAEKPSNSLYDRAWSSAAILRIAADDVRAIDFLTWLCASGNRKERIVGFVTLGYSRARSIPAMNALRKGLVDPTVEVRTLAAWGLQIRGVPPSEILSVLRAALREPGKLVLAQPYYHGDIMKPTHWTYALGALRSLGRDAREAVPELIDVLNHCQDSVEQFRAVGALQAIGPDAAPALDTLRRIAAIENAPNKAAIAAAIAAIE